MTSGPDDVHVLLGAYVLGGLSDDDHRAFTEHVRTCRQCQAELGQVSGLPRLLDLAGPGGGPHLAATLGSPEPVAAPPGDGRVADLLAAVARRRRRRLAWLSGAAAAAAAAVFAGGAWLGPGLVVASPPTSHYVASAAPGSGSAGRVDVALVTRGWGTQVDLDCEDMPTDGTLVLYVIDEGGHGVAAASWRATKSGYSRVTGATALSPSEIRTIEVRTGSGQVVASTQT
jgi:hypothetical protein